MTNEPPRIAWAPLAARLRILAVAQEGDPRQLARPAHAARVAVHRRRRGADLPRADLQPDRKPGRPRARAQAAGDRHRPARPRSRRFSCATRSRCAERRRTTRRRSARGDIDVVLVVDADFAKDVAEGRQGRVRLVSDRSRDRAQPSIRQAETLLRAYNRLWGGQRLLLRGISPAVGESARHRGLRSRHTAAVGRDRAVPRRVLRPARFGDGRHGGVARYDGGRARAAVARAAPDDAGASDRARRRQVDRRLALQPARRVASRCRGFYLTLAFAPLPAVGIPFLFSAREFGRFLVVLLPVVLMIPAILLYVGTRGRTYKEAQTNVSVLMFVVSLAAGRAALPAADASRRGSCWCRCPGNTRSCARRCAARRSTRPARSFVRRARGAHRRRARRRGAPAVARIDPVRQIARGRRTSAREPRER